MLGNSNKTRKRRKHFSAEEKLSIVQASYEVGNTIARVSREYDVGASTLVKWRRNALEGSLMGVKDDDVGISGTEAKKLKKEIEQLQKLLGKKSLQIEILQEAIELAREKKLISHQHLFGVDTILSD